MREQSTKTLLNQLTKTVYFKEYAVSLKRRND